MHASPWSTHARAHSTAVCAARAAWLGGKIESKPPLHAPACSAKPSGGVVGSCCSGRPWPSVRFRSGSGGYSWKPGSPVHQSGLGARFFASPCGLGRPHGHGLSTLPRSCTCATDGVRVTERRLRKKSGTNCGEECRHCVSRGAAPCHARGTRARPHGACHLQHTVKQCSAVSVHTEPWIASDGCNV
jgi:hypothetical protein